MFAVIKTGGKQYKVSAEDVITIEKLDAESGSTVTFEEVLMLGGDNAQIGAPLVEGATVVGEVVEQGRARKIIIFKKKRRQGYKRTKGHRQHQTTVRITDILAAGEKASAKPKAKAAAKPAVAAEAKADTTPLFTAPAGSADDLKKISGVGPVLEKKLNELGITTFAQVAAFTDEDIARVDERLNFKGRIDRENWLQQAADLAAGK